MSLPPVGQGRLRQRYIARRKCSHFQGVSAICSNPQLEISHLIKIVLVILSENETTLLIGVEGAQTPAGGRDREDPAGRSPRRLPDRPQESEAPGTEINKVIYLFFKKNNCKSPSC
ncbi:hypothetical protein AB685_17180 [Bacillus sp. LL01]|nr:hypothetical protein AB685_17180 [Bacillus sp. LL01]